ncbi:MAG: nucleotidyltransferase domain-containing protein [Cyanobacteriota bacterium]
MADQRIIKQIVNVVLSVIKPEKIILFGSQSYGNPSTDSDYDILIIIDGIQDHYKLLKKLYRKMIEVDAAVDIILKNTEEVEESKQRLVSVVKDALNKGTVIYE